MTSLSLCSSFFCCFLMVRRSTRKAPCDPAIAISCAPSAVYCVATEVNIRAGRPCFHSCSAGSTPSRHPLAPRGHCRADGVIRTRNSKKQKREKGDRAVCSNALFLRQVVCRLRLNPLLYFSGAHFTCYWQHLNSSHRTGRSLGRFEIFFFFAFPFETRCEIICAILDFAGKRCEKKKC